MPLYYPWTGKGYISGFTPTLLAELSIREASNAIREKPNWWIKIKDSTIAANWRRDLLEESRKREERFHMTDEQIDYVFKELDWLAQKRQEQVGNGARAPIEIGVEGTRRADGLVPEELRARLLECVKKLEDVPDDKKNWHPGSDEQVLDLVHPSLFSFVAGRTRVTDVEAIPPLDFITAGKVLDVAPVPKSSTVRSVFYSKTHQWLPTDFDITPEGKIKARSYINNLHPVEHEEMYPVLEEILEKFLPMFEEVLAEIEKIPPKILKPNRNYYGPVPEFGEEFEEEFEEEDEEEDEDEDEGEGGDDDGQGDKAPKASKTPKEPKKPKEVKVYEWYSEKEYYKNRLPLPIVISEFEPRPDLTPYNLKVPSKPLQVIVKLANIEITPLRPTYPGGSWHVEGMANESIVATGIYYYDTENITDSRLKFRINIKEPSYEQSNDKGTKHLYGIMNDDLLRQRLDGIITKQDRCLVFPNIFQHKVQSFSLVDPTKPGYRKILAFFLVNPEEPILSTTFVPPQQQEWDNRPFVKEANKKLPPELLREVDHMVDWPMDLEEAKRHRADLMVERRYFSETINTDLFERPFSLCEH
ncbi:hypothetical protein BGZ89_003959 [Linnemannia elongata]|nr:hypothetical protein BGZ89_003959 [Linnemannia elongata]